MTSRTEAAPPFPDAMSPTDYLIAIKQIESVIADYAIGLDSRDMDRFLSAFHSEATLDVAKGVITGRESIREWAEEVFSYRTIGHLTGNHRIELHDLNRASSVGGGLGLSTMPDGAIVFAFAQLTDRYVKIGNIWQIEYRRVALVSAFELPGAVPIMINGKPVNAG
ncbi:MAG TPA: nuclear transport factor 2 family protein [Sphingobium sp.]